MSMSSKYCPKKAILTTSMIVSGLLFAFTAMLVNAMSSTYNAVNQLCTRVEASVDRLCEVTPISYTGPSMCQDQCRDAAVRSSTDTSFLDDVLPTLVNIDGGESEANNGQSDDAQPSSQGWTDFNQKGEICQTKNYFGIKSDHKVVVDCSCTRSHVQISVIKTPIQHQVVNLGCTKVTWKASEASKARGVASPCLYLPAVDDQIAELAMGVHRWEEEAKCEIWLKKFSSNGNVHWIYMTLCCLFAWMSFVSCVALMDLVRRADKLHEAMEMDVFEKYTPQLVPPEGSQRIIGLEDA
eukprot:TRINITY_DN102555_c0_g1_i1.p1 TRINITY_DN102555_c0_g1~~TRINITY_DN102555_c0_g1_i1.p1  ORF type:complete len:296 (-),score=72.41 TRINITY_DN102555_c0_g1_i1:320-1207(-)